MKRLFEKATTIRLPPDIRAQIRAIAQAEGNHEAAVLRRVIALGLKAIADRPERATLPD